MKNQNRKNQNQIIVSIDPGIKNFGIAVAEKTQNGILRLLSVKRVDISSLHKNPLLAIKKALDDLLCDQESIHQLVIERQPPINRKMCYLSVAIKSYFLWKNEKIKITEIHAKKKTLFFNYPIVSKYKTEYAKRKDISVQQISRMIESKELCNEYLICHESLVEQSKNIFKDKKKDEYCDVINQLIASNIK